MGMDPKCGGLLMFRWLKKNWGFLLLFVVVFVFFKLFVMISLVPSESMEPTISSGSVSLFNRTAFWVSAPKKGDIVVFWSEEKEKLLVKRVIGTEGDVISFQNGSVTINDAPEAWPSVGTTQGEREEYIVPDDCVFLLGDNREHSQDARSWDNPFVSIKSIKGEWISFGG